MTSEMTVISSSDRLLCNTSPALSTTCHYHLYISTQAGWLLTREPAIEIILQLVVRWPHTRKNVLNRFKSLAQSRFINKSPREQLLKESRAAPISRTFLSNVPPRVRASCKKSGNLSPREANRGCCTDKIWDHPVKSS